MDSGKCNVLAAVLALALPAAAPAALLGARAAPPAPAGVESPAPKAAASARVTPAWPAPAPAPPTRLVGSPNEDAGTRAVLVPTAGGGLLLDEERLSNWTRAPVAERYSYEWTNRWLAGVRLGLAEAPATVLTGLDDAPWRSYLAALRREHGARLRVAVDDDSDRNRDMVRVLGGRTRVLDFELAPATPDEPPRRVVQVCAQHGNRIVVFSIEGPARTVASAVRGFESLVTRIEPARPAS